MVHPVKATSPLALSPPMILSGLADGPAGRQYYLLARGYVAMASHGQVEPLASAMSPPSPPRQTATGAALPPVVRAVTPRLPPAGGRPGRRRRGPPAWIGWAIAGGFAAVCALVAGVAVLLNPPTAGRPRWAPDGEESASQDWGYSIRVPMIGQDRQVETTFRVGLKDAWWTDRSSLGWMLPEDKSKRTLVVVYCYRNLGRGRVAFGLMITRG